MNCPSHFSKVLTYLPSNNLNANSIYHPVLHVINSERFKVHVFRLCIANTSIICLNEHPVIVVGFVIFWSLWLVFFFFA